MDHRKYMRVLEEQKVTDNLKILVSLSLDETKVFLDVDFMKGVYTTQRTFTNSFYGWEDLEKTKLEFLDEELVKTYFGL